MRVRLPCFFTVGLLFLLALTPFGVRVCSDLGFLCRFSFSLISVCVGVCLVFYSVSVKPSSGSFLWCLSLLVWSDIRCACLVCCFIRAQISAGANLLAQPVLRWLMPRVSLASCYIVSTTVLLFSTILVPLAGYFFQRTLTGFVLALSSLFLLASAAAALQATAFGTYSTTRALPF